MQVLSPSIYISLLPFPGEQITASIRHSSVIHHRPTLPTNVLPSSVVLPPPSVIRRSFDQFIFCGCIVLEDCRNDEDMQQGGEEEALIFTHSVCITYTLLAE